MPRKTDPIHKITLKTGKVRYRFVVDVGKKPKLDEAGEPVLKADGHPMLVRDQRTYTYDSHRTAKEERSKIIADLAKGTYVADTRITVTEYLTSWLEGRRNIKASTKANYRNALKPVKEQLGAIPLQKLTRAQVDSLVTSMLASGRRVGTKGNPLAGGTVTLMLTVLAMALDAAMKEGILVRNVARLVDRPKASAHEMSTWTAEQAAVFLTSVAGDRLSAAWQMSLYGLRRGEVLGLRWEDVDLEAGQVSIRKTRTLVDGEVVIDEPKSERGKRTLPIDKGLSDALKALQTQQKRERLKAGTAYARTPWVFVDELGEPVHPESYSDRFEVLVRKAKLSKIRLHDTRHTCGTLMHLRGVPAAVISAWLGHAKASFTMATYVHSQADALRDAGATLTAAYTASS